MLCLFCIAFQGQHDIFKRYCKRGTLKRYYKGMKNGKGGNTVPEQSYFHSALSNFTHEVCSGGAIRHLTDLGYTARQIAGQLDYPTPFSRVRQEMWQRLIETDVILLEEPGSGKTEKTSYVREYDKFGRSSFRRVVEAIEEENAPVCWRELHAEGEGERVPRILQEKIDANAEVCSYMSCDFGLLAYREPEHLQRLLKSLEKEHREYVEGLPWATRRVYHRLDNRMRSILLRLYELGEYSGICFFVKTGDKLYFG